MDDKLTFEIKLEENTDRKRWEQIIFFTDNKGRKHDIISFSFDFQPNKPYKGRNIQASEIYIEKLGFDYQVVHFQDRKIKEIVDSCDVNYWTLHSSSHVNLHLKNPTRKISTPINHSIVRHDLNNYNLQQKIPIFSFGVKYEILAKKMGVDINEWTDFIYLPLDSFEMSLKYVPTQHKIDSLYNGKRKKVWNRYFDIADFSDNTSLILCFNEKATGNIIKINPNDAKQVKAENDAIKRYRMKWLKHLKKTLKHVYDIHCLDVNKLFTQINYSGSDGIIGYDRNIKTLRDKLFINFI